MATKGSTKKHRRSDLSAETVWLNQFERAVSKLHVVLAKDINWATARYLYAAGKHTPQHAAEQYVHNIVTRMAMKGANHGAVFDRDTSS